MPGRDITPLRNRVLLLLAFLICAGLLAGMPVWPQSAPPQAPSAAPQSQSSANQAAAQTPGQKAEPSQEKPEENKNLGDQGVFVFKKDVDEVLLHATVVDDKQHLVTNLEKGAFSVFEDGKPQNIISFHHEDIPVAMGIVIDNSGSMREKRNKVNQAALNLVRSSNPHDEVFVVNFNDEYYLDQDFTNDLLKLKEALEKIDARGGTALYDAVVASADHLKRNARLEKKVIFVVTDGEDNASNESLEQAVKQLQEENGPSVYAIGILGDEEHPKRARRALEIIAQRTGGIAFFPKTLDEVDEISRTVARDIRNQYTIGYKPTNPRGAGGFRLVKVEAKVKGHGKLTVRTKSGYYAGQARAAGAASK
ncbi:MAG TPA: VWA domain-containing protein [Candidatus Acidoferrum sp.]|nr:VWA domain-containing protein [Candidatus Acidoferrum sp.]